MSNSTTLLDLISSTQANKEAVANALFDAASPSTLWGRRASTTTGLTWGYYGGTYYVNGSALSVLNGSLSLTASATNYVFANATTGAVSANTTGVPAGSVPLYTIVAGTTTVTSYTDLRSFQYSAVGGAGSAGLAGAAVQTAAYTYVAGDKGLTLVMNSATAVNQNLPTATGTSGSFPSGWYGSTENIGAGTMTLGVASGASLDGVTNGTLVLRQNSGCSYFTDGTNWYTVRGVSAAQLQYLGDVSVTPGAAIDQYALVYNNATGKWIAKSISGGGTTTAPVGLVAYMTGTYTASQTLLKALVPMAVTLPLNLAQSYAKCDVAPTAAVVCPITQNGTSIGSVNFAAGATSGTFTFATQISVLPGDVIIVAAPSTADATFAGAAISLLASAPATATPVPLSGRNIAVDGNFDSWQAGTSFSLGSGAYRYTADMWVAGTAVGAAATISQVVAAPGSEPVGMTTPRKYKLRYAMTTAGGGLVSQRIERVELFNGRSVTVSVYLTAAAAATLVTGVTYTQNFGTGGSPSANVSSTTAVTWAVGTTETRFSVRLDIPSISGKTLGTNGDDFLEIQLNLATGATFTLDASQFQVEECSPTSSSDVNGAGGAPTPFEYRGQALELARVGRYLAVFSGTPASGASWDGLYIGWAHVVTSANPGDVRAVVRLPDKMRAAPAVSITGTIYVLSGQTAVSATGIGVSGVFDGYNFRGSLIGADSTTVSVGFNGALVLGGSTTPVSLIFDARV